METKKFIDYLRAFKDDEMAIGMEKYMRNQFPFIGLQATKRRKLAQPYLTTLVQEAKKRVTDNDDQSIVDWEAVHML